MGKIIFVNLLDLDNMYVRTKQMGQLSLYNIIENSEKWEAEIWDANYMYLKRRLKLYASNEHNYRIMVEDILKRNPTYVSIYTMCNNYHQALSIAQLIKTNKPSVKIILAGPQASTVASKTLEIFDFVDYIALGEGEKTILDILDFIDEEIINGTSNREIKGLAYRDSNKNIVERWSRDNWCDLNMLEPLKYELVDEDVFDGKTSIDMEIGRGCPFACTYCSTSMFWERNFRVKSVEKVVSEVELCRKKYHVSTFSFHHDLLTANKKYIMELSNALIEKELKIVWACYSRLDVIDHEMITAMAKAGCHQIYYGIETGSPRMQKVINKNLDLQKIYEIMDSMAENNVKAEFSFIIGYPEETQEDLIKTIEYIKSIKEYELKKKRNLVIIHIFQIMFFPKTQMTQECLGELVYNPLILEGDTANKAFAALPDEVKWIKENKEIFVNYYNLPKNITNKAKNFNIFLMMLFNYGYNYCSSTVKEAINKKSSIIGLYDWLYDNKQEGLSQLLYYIYFDHSSRQDEICKRVKELFTI